MASGSSVGAPTFAIETDKDEDGNADGEQLDIADVDKGCSPMLLLHLSAASSARHSACTASGARAAGAYAISEWTRAQRTAARAWTAAAGTCCRLRLRRRRWSDDDVGPGLGPLLAAAESSVSSLLLLRRRMPKEAMPASGAGMASGLGEEMGRRLEGRFFSPSLLPPLVRFSALSKCEQRLWLRSVRHRLAFSRKTHHSRSELATISP